MAGTLEPIAALVKEDQGLILELQEAPFAEKDSGILESYLAKIRHDGVAKHADMQQPMDQLAENNTAIVTLLKALELFMAGGSYAASGIPFPKDLPAAVNAEIAAAK